MTNSLSEKHSFQAEVQQLLHIVIHSLYTDREIFLRELVSNASDALEKLRHLQLTEPSVYDANLPLEINITTDDSAHTLTIQDFGVGMTRDELKENLGTIAHSGSRAFVEALKTKGSNNEALIGQFGVGFYSAFMVAEEVRLYTHSYREDGESLVWTSTGTGDYTIDVAEGQRRGAKIVLKLKPDCHEFAKDSRVREILERYSRFVQFPISLNGERINTQEAIWLKSKSEVKAEQYQEFYKFIAHSSVDALDWLHFNADAPLAINALVFIPHSNPERLGFGKQDSGVALYSRKILIDPHPESLLPDWLRFLRGVIDSADLPLNISRESMQDSALLNKLSKVVTKRVIRHLTEKSQKKPEEYAAVWKQFGIYLKEGIATDFEYRNDLAPLLRFESSHTAKGATTSLDDYLSRMPEDQKDIIYYLFGSSREAVENSPYIEILKARNIEVIYLYEPIDEYVFRSLAVYKEKHLTAADSSAVDVTKPDDAADQETALPAEESKSLCDWLKTALEPYSVDEVKISSRLLNSPAAAFCSDRFMTPGMQRLMRQMSDDRNAAPLKVDLEINPASPLIRNLARIRRDDPGLATELAYQILDNALIAAGLLDDPQRMSTRLNELLVKLTTLVPSARE